MIRIILQVSSVDMNITLSKEVKDNVFIDDIVQKCCICHENGRYNEALGVFTTYGGIQVPLCKRHAKIYAKGIEKPGDGLYTQKIKITNKSILDIADNEPINLKVDENGSEDVM